VGRAIRDREADGPRSRKNRQGEIVVDGNIYGDMLTHIYMVEKG
jgi:hypothetical protein